MKIYQIEITNKCNLTCDYCPRKYMMRKLGVMSIKTLKAVLDNIENDILRLHHYGESLLDEELIEKISFIKTKKPKMILVLSTNGTLLTGEITKALFNAGLSQIIISYHNKDSIKHIKDIDPIYRERIEIIKMSKKEENMKYFRDLGYQANTKRLRDLGQIKHKEVLKTNAIDRCSFLKNNEVAILWDGTIVPCCECFDDYYILGNINKDKRVESKWFPLCRSCIGYGNDEKETERL